MTRSGPLNDSEILAAFLEEFSNPTPADWKKLIQAHPAHASSLAEAHLAFLFMSKPSDEAEPPINQQSVSRVLARVMEGLKNQSDDVARELDAQINKATGKAARGVAQKIFGFDDCVQLFNGVLAGRVLAPVAVLNKLADFFSTAPGELAVAFHRRFECAAAPAFKAEGQKPSADALPTPWVDAVRGASLPEATERQLLALSD
jgi:hypothetical protein